MNMLKGFENDAVELNATIIKKNDYIKNCLINCKDNEERKEFALEEIKSLREFFEDIKNKYEFYRTIKDFAQELTGEKLKNVSLFDLDVEPNLVITKKIDKICTVLIKNINVTETLIGKLIYTMNNLEFLNEFVNNTYYKEVE